MEKPKTKKVSSLLDKPWVLAVFGVLALVLAYVFALWALDSGNVIDYLLFFALLFVGCRDLWLAIRKRK